MVSHGLLAGSAAVDVTPNNSVFLYGYPNVPRWSTGVHDPLLASALHLSDGITSALFIACDVILVSRATTARVRERVTRATGIPGDRVLISATHTHSGPIMVDYLSNEHDPVVPKVDAAYLRWFEDRVVEAAVRATESAEPAEAGLGVGDATGVGTNRRDPSGPSDRALPVLLIRRRDGGEPLALMLICAMHPTVLHEDSTLVSGDFPGLARRHLQQRLVGAACPVLYHTGPAGNQSPRHVISGNTLAEADRLGGIVAEAAARAVEGIRVHAQLPIACGTRRFQLPLRTFASVEAAQRNLEAAVQRLEALRRRNAPRAEVRTAECDWFGAAETVTLARAAADGRLADAAAACLPAEVQAICLGDWNSVGWPGEMFVEFGLKLKAACPGTHIITYANGELQGYLVTQQAVDEGGYEASNALFKSPDGGELLVRETQELLRTLRQ